MTPGTRVLAIDYGERRIRLAVSDPFRIFASGMGTLVNSPSVTGEVRRIVEESSIGKIVVGMPYAADGGKGQKAQEVDGFIARLRERVAVPVETWDESYTSVEAHRAFREGGMKKKQRQEKPRVDVMAARLLLQEYLDQAAGRPPRPPATG